MCLIIAIISLVFSFNLYMAGNILGAMGGVLTSVFFIYLMIKNIYRVKKEREKNDN